MIKKWNFWNEKWIGFPLHKFFVLLLDWMQVCVKKNTLKWNAWTISLLILSSTSTANIAYYVRHNKGISSSIKCHRGLSIKYKWILEITCILTYICTDTNKHTWTRNIGILDIMRHSKTIRERTTSFQIIVFL